MAQYPKKCSVAVLGAGGRGQGFGEVIGELGHVAVVAAVAEPRQAYREKFAVRHKLDNNLVFKTWQDFVERPKLCDAVVISTQDRDHIGPALACLEKGYHLLLEKPMAVTLEDCRAIEAAQRKSGKVVAICHSLRCQKGFAKVKDIVSSGKLGRIITMDQLERVQYWHQAHSYVRGNWGNEGRSSFMLLAKSCHDIDFIAYMMEKTCLRVSSFGALSYFRRENAPKGSTARCTDGCAVEHMCAYSAIRQYVNTPRREGWPANVISPVHTREAHLNAIRTGPYGQCVFRCDNDVVDHQVVLLEFAGDCTATFTMTAFTGGAQAGRQIRIHGTEGELLFEEGRIEVRTFADNNVEHLAIGPETGGHGGGDPRVVGMWLEAIQENKPDLVLTNAQESLRTHTIVFAAEKSRREKRQVEIAEM